MNIFITSKAVWIILIRFRGWKNRICCLHRMSLSLKKTDILIHKLLFIRHDKVLHTFKLKLPEI